MTKEELELEELAKSTIDISIPSRDVINLITKLRRYEEALEEIASIPAELIDSHIRSLERRDCARQALKEK